MPRGVRVKSVLWSSCSVSPAVGRGKNSFIYYAGGVSGDWALLCPFGVSLSHARARSHTQNAHSVTTTTPFSLPKALLLLTLFHSFSPSLHSFPFRSPPPFPWALPTLSPSGPLSAVRIIFRQTSLINDFHLSTRTHETSGNSLPSGRGWDAPEAGLGCIWGSWGSERRAIYRGMSG
jgi:hypothetical protein